MCPYIYFSEVSWPKFYVSVWSWLLILYTVCFWRDRPPPHPVGQGLLIHEFSRSHNDAPQLVGLLWTNDQPVAETSTWQTIFTRDKTSIPRVGFESTISAGERPQTYALDRAATETGNIVCPSTNKNDFCWGILGNKYKMWRYWARSV